MNPARQQAIIVDMIKCLRGNDDWAGETHVQKCMYFLQEGLNIPLGFDFIMYKHGPFSFELRSRLSSMRAERLLRTEERPPYGDSLEVGERGNSIAERLEKVITTYHPQVKYIAEQVAPKGAGVAELERLGTALFVIKEHPGEDESVLAERITELKPHVSFGASMQAIVRTREILERAPESNREGMR